MHKNYTLFIIQRVTKSKRQGKKFPLPGHSNPGLSRVRAEYPNQLDYNGFCCSRKYKLLNPVFTSHSRQPWPVDNCSAGLGFGCAADESASLPCSGIPSLPAGRSKKHRAPAASQLSSRQQGMAPGFLAKQNARTSLALILCLALAPILPSSQRNGTILPGAHICRPR